MSLVASQFELTSNVCFEGVDHFLFCPLFLQWLIFRSCVFQVSNRCGGMSFVHKGKACKLKYDVSLFWCMTSKGAISNNLDVTSVLKQRPHMETCQTGQKRDVRTHGRRPDHNQQAKRFPRLTRNRQNLRTNEFERTGNHKIGNEDGIPSLTPEANGLLCDRLTDQVPIVENIES
ncbi:hypothetical protein T05_3506 [Trichinella murrelli]|uniref:FLYWCH-type domain-containing protein n=1 Tax=Trichinella murrelli TaxID=144512 RepID=A0A0V0TY40_9BILA|nr:hypothetical protein T05_3506 [Trichinella murrelli]